MMDPMLYSSISGFPISIRRRQKNCRESKTELVWECKGKDSNASLRDLLFLHTGLPLASCYLATSMFWVIILQSELFLILLGPIQVDGLLKDL